MYMEISMREIKDQTKKIYMLASGGTAISIILKEWRC